MKREIQSLTQERDKYKLKADNLEYEYNNYKAKMKQYEMVDDNNTITAEPEKKLPTIDDLEIKHYFYYITRTYDYMVITNNSESNIGLNVNGRAKDKDGNILALGDGSLNILGPGETGLIALSYPVKEYDSIDYDIKIKETTSSPYLGLLSYEVTENKNNIVLAITNNGLNAPMFVEGFVVFLDKNNNVISVSDEFIMDEDWEIKSGDTLYEQFWVTGKKAYDHYEVYFGK